MTFLGFGLYVGIILYVEIYNGYIGIRQGVYKEYVRVIWGIRISRVLEVYGRVNNRGLGFRL